MLVICEECAKKYDIDESRIKGKKARFTCRECGHIITVEKPEKTTSSPESKAISDEEVLADVVEKVLAEEQQGATYAAPSPDASGTPSTPKGKGIRIGTYIIVTMITGFLFVTGAFSYLYLTFIPKILNTQIELRTKAITTAFSGIIQKPLVLRHYLQVNKEAQRISRIPGVAYAAVVNKNDIVIAGFFNDLNRFDNKFVEQVKKKGFPKEIIAQNKLLPGNTGKNVKIVAGGQKLVDEVSFVPDTESEVHVGVFVAEVDDAIRNALVSPLTLSLFGAVLLVGLIMLIILSKLIAKPMRELTDIANRISFGQLDLTVTPRGPREMRELATAFERMRFSIKAAMDRLRK